MNSFTPSPEQEAFYDVLRTSPRNLMLRASAGSGKTTTIVHGTRLLPLGFSTKFLAFNKNIERELSSRLPPFVSCSTFHSAGYGALRSAYPKIGKPNPDKCRDILLKRVTKREFETLAAPVLRLVGFAKNHGLGTELATATPDDFYNLLYHFALDPGEAGEERVVEVASKLLEESSADLTSSDFDDMLYLPLRLNLSLNRYNFLFIDEAQDTNGVQRALLKRMLSPAPFGRLIAVGDPDQAIYGFRGADAEAMATLVSEFSMLELDLSVSWRCSRAVVREAQKFCNTH